MNQSDQQPSAIEERRFKLDEERLRLESSFARKWLPTLATMMVGFVAAVFGYVEHHKTLETTERTRIETTAKDEREWGFRVVEMYLNKRELFDLMQNPDQAAANLRFLYAVAPNVVQSVFDTERARIPAPGAEGETNNSQRLQSLAAVAQVQSAIKGAKGEELLSATKMVPSDFLVYVQYAGDSRDRAVQAQKALQDQGFRAPGIELVRKVPPRLQVRYYRREQKDFAGDLATQLGRTLGLPATADNAILVESKKELPSGILELWLPQATTQ